MRVLFAADASRGAARARTLLRALHLARGSTIRVVRVLGAEPTLASLPDAMQTEVVAGSLATLQRDVTAFAKSLRRESMSLEAQALRGRVASTIVREAARWRADLVVVGSNSRGAIASAILGSVAAEVVDHCPCPVLVARTTKVSSIVLADDGSSDAKRAARVIGTRIFHAPVRVVSAVNVTPPLSSGIAPTVWAAAIDAHRKELTARRAEHKRLARRAAEQLRGVGIKATADVREGDPGDEILAATAENGADLIAMGTRGHTGLRRLLLGSVARKVLLHTRCSVLVARASSRAKSLRARRPR